MGENSNGNPLSEIDVVVLCGGKGTRLQSILPHIPKVLAPIKGRPFLNYLLENLVAQGFRRIILATGHLSEQVENYIKASPWRAHPAAQILFSKEEAPAGTGGAIQIAANHIQGNHFLVVNGDTFVNINFSDFFNFHNQQNALMTVAVRSRKDRNNHAHVIITEDQRVKAFSSEENAEGSYLIMSGAYLLSKEVLEYVKAPSSLEIDVLPSILHKPIFVFKVAEDFLDIGTPDRYNQAQE